MQKWTVRGGNGDRWCQRFASRAFAVCADIYDYRSRGVKGQIFFKLLT